MASTTAILRSAGAPGTAVADWKAVTVEQFAGFIQAGPDMLRRLLRSCAWARCALLQRHMVDMGMAGSLGLSFNQSEQNRTYSRYV